MFGIQHGTALSSVKTCWQPARVRTGHGKPGKSWNSIISFSRPRKSWNLGVGHGKSVRPLWVKGNKIQCWKISPKIRFNFSWTNDCFHFTVGEQLLNLVHAIFRKVMEKSHGILTGQKCMNPSENIVFFFDIVHLQ